MTKAQKIVWMSVGTWVAVIPAVLWANSSGPDVRYTGAPGDDKNACAACHSNLASGGPINTAGGSVVAVFSPANYTPGQDVSITVTVSDPVNKLFGFQMTARLDSNLTKGQAGTFTPGGSDTFVLCDNNQTRRGSCPGAFPVEFIEHTAPSRNSFSFKWTAPSTDVGPVHFYVAGNAVNGDGTDSGADHTYTASYTISSGTPCTVGTPSVAAVVSATAFGQAKSFSAGSWLEIYGSNLGNNTREWGGSDFVGSSAPTKLDNVQVAINGKNAAVRFISPGQVNVQAPGDSATGPVNVTVTNCTGTSPPLSVSKADLVPGVLAFTVNDKQYLEAFTLGGAFTGNPNAPAKPGDIIVAYGIGFGDTTPSTTPGTIVPAINSLANPFTVLFGTAPDPKPLYAGLGPGFVGLYQFDLTVPQLADGDYPITFQVGNVKVAQTLLFTVKK
jgi:uncharacterized protein (TIGR03437 family)